MGVPELLSLLERVRKIGPNRWAARCPVPAHADRTPSLRVRELDDGRILVKCFGLCSVYEVLAAISMEMADLFPKITVPHGQAARRPFFPADVFNIVRCETGIVAVIAADLHKRKAVAEADYVRLFTAVEKLNEIAGAAYGK